MKSKLNIQSIHSIDMQTTQKQTMDDGLNVNVNSLENQIGEAKYHFRMLQNTIDFATETAINDPSQSKTMASIIKDAVKLQREYEGFLLSNGISFNGVLFV